MGSQSRARTDHTKPDNQLHRPAAKQVVNLVADVGHLVSAWFYLRGPVTINPTSWTFNGALCGTGLRLFQGRRRRQHVLGARMSLEFVHGRPLSKTCLGIVHSVPRRAACWVFSSIQPAISDSSQPTA